MSKVAARFALLILLLTVLQPFCSAAASEPSRDDVHKLLFDAGDMIVELNRQISSMQSLANQLGSCPNGETDPCTAASSVANSVLSILRTKTKSASTEIDSATSDFQKGNANMTEVLNKVGNALSTVNDGILLADTESDKIPASCPDQSGDICSEAKGAVSQAILSASSSYRYVKDEYDKLAGSVSQPTQQETEDKQKNDKLLSVYATLGEAQRLRETIKTLEQNGAPQLDIEFSKARLRDMEKELTDTYEEILQNPRYKDDFWTNWDYATLKKNQGDMDQARELYTTALSSTHVDEKSKKDFLNKLKKDSQDELKTSEQPKSDSKVMQSISKGLHNLYDKAQWAKSAAFSDFHASFFLTMAKAGKVMNDIQQFEDTFSGRTLENNVGEATR